MADLDIVNLILSEHDAFRRDFDALMGLTDPDELGQRWADLSARLEVHASAEEAVLYPRVLVKVDDSEDDTVDAISDHNKIRDGIRAAEDQTPGSDAWWEGVKAAKEENDEHLEEEERDVLPPFRSDVSDAERAELGQQWLAFRDEHYQARGLSGDDKDPQAYVEAHEP